MKLAKGLNTISREMVVANPKLWWPNGHGEQPLNDMVVPIGDEVSRKRIALRDMVILNEKDERDTSMTIQPDLRLDPVRCHALAPDRRAPHGPHR